MHQAADTPKIVDLPRRRFFLPQSVRRDGAALMHRQCWLWGQDVKRPRANVLMDFGFTRHRAPEAERKQGCTGYQLRLPKGRVIVLWGFGLFYGDRALGGMYLKRYGFPPRLLDEARLQLPIWKPDQLPKLRNARTPEEWQRTLKLLVAAMKWIGKYEQWVIESRGLIYRRRCLMEWKDDGYQAGHLTADWQALAAQCETLLLKQEERNQ
jgi:hypothetical protein